LFTSRDWVYDLKPCMHARSKCGRLAGFKWDKTLAQRSDVNTASWRLALGIVTSNQLWDRRQRGKLALVANTKSRSMDWATEGM